MPISSANCCRPSGMEVQNLCPLKCLARKIVSGMFFTSEGYAEECVAAYRKSFDF